MRFHVSGVGAIGTLLSFHLKRTSRRLIEEPNSIKSLPHTSSIPYLPSPFELGVILRLRKQGITKQAQNKLNTSVTVERDHARQKESGFGVVYQALTDQIGGVFGKHPLQSSSGELLAGTSRLEELGYPKGSIDALIVTTKAQNTLAALRPLVPHITSATTIVLLQNGQGVLDLLLEKLFTDLSKRPHFILASTTHGAYTINKRHCVHAGFGRIDFGVVPSRSLGRDYERLLEQSSTSIEEIDEDEEGEDNYSSGSTSELTSYSRLLPPRKQRPKEERRTHLQTSPLLDISAIPSMPTTQTLIYTMSTLLNLPLSVTWQPIRNFQMLSLKKLVVNACINPVTALVECRNGDLFGNKYASNTIRDLCTEISLILETVAHKAHLRQAERLRIEQRGDDNAMISEASGSDYDLMNKSDYLLTPSNAMGTDFDSGVPALDSSLRAGALFREVQRVAQLTAPNFSSMLQDIQTKAPSTEIDFINGYFSRLGKSLGIATPVNDLMVNLIHLKTTRTSAPWTSKM